MTVSSLFFTTWTGSKKPEMLTEINRVLKPGGRLHIADWGKPSSLLQRALLLLVQCLDGFETTRESVQDLLPGLLGETGFVDVSGGTYIPTALGTVRLLQAAKS